MYTRFLVVDDDPVNNMVCKYQIGKVFKNADILCFELPAEGLKFILSDYNDPGKVIPTVVFLDINMPEISGWDFLDEFSKMPGHIHEQLSIYIVSTSIDRKDMEKAKQHPFVKDFLSKPLEEGVLKGALST